MIRAALPSDANAISRLITESAREHIVPSLTRDGDPTEHSAVRYQPMRILLESP